MADLWPELESSPLTRDQFTAFESRDVTQLDKESNRA